MWPMLLNLTRDECRRTLRSLELEAYSNMISVFRAQGALEDNRKKLLEELRAVLHISNDRHSAEARRVSNDELLATIADRLVGPNTGLGWICEGRRRVPLLPRGVAQSIYTEIADKAAEAAVAENKEILKKLESDKLVAPKTNEGDIAEVDAYSAENEEMDEMLYVPVATEDETAKLWETELISRKRKLPESGAVPDDTITPVKNMRNIPVNTNQKHLNLSQIYSKFSQPATSKPLSQSKHSYNQVSKVSTSKSNQGHPQPAPHKHRQKRAKNTAPIVVSKSQVKPQANTLSPSKVQVEYSGPPNTFQASYAKAVMATNQSKFDYLDDIKSRAMSSPGMVTDSPTMQLLTQPAAVPHELGVSDNAHPDNPSLLQAQATPMPKHTISGKPCHLIIKSKGDITTTADKKVQMSDMKVLQKPADGIKLLGNRQVVVASSATQKALNTSGKFVTTKVISSVKQKGPCTPVITEKMIVVSKPVETRGIPNSKITITSSGHGTPIKAGKSINTNSISPKTSEAFTPKGIPATDLKVSAKAVVLNPKSGQKMVVLPAKARSKGGGEGPMVPVQLKGFPNTVKLVPVSSQPATPIGRPSTLTVVSKPTIVSTITPKKIIGVEPIKTANLADIVPAKGMTPVTTPKISNPVIRTANTKGNVIVVQKGSTIGKALTFSKNGSDMSKIIMGKNVNQLLATNVEQAESSKCAGNVIVLELNNEQMGRTTTMSEILCNRGPNTSSDDDKKVSHEITQDTPVLFDTHIPDETCNANSLDSNTESIEDIQIETSLVEIRKDGNKRSFGKDSEAGKDSSSVTDWEMELETPGKGKGSKLNSLHLDLGMSSDSDSEYMVERKSKSTHSSQESLTAAPSGQSSVYSSASGMSLATRTLLSQLQDDGSSSNDCSFTLKTKSEKLKDTDCKIDKCESDALTKAKEKLSEKVAKSQLKRIDIYSTAITSSDINLESFSYLEEGIMEGDERRDLDDQLSRLLGEDSANSTDSQPVSESMPLNK